MSKQVLKNQDGPGTDLTVKTNVSVISKEQYEQEQAILKQIETDGFFDDAIGIQKKYWDSPSSGETISGIFLGFEILTSQKGESLPAVVVRTRKGDFLSAATALVDAFAEFLPNGVQSKIPINTAVQITCTGKKATSNGNKMLTFDVKAKL